MLTHQIPIWAYVLLTISILLILVVGFLLIETFSDTFDELFNGMNDLDDKEFE